MLCTLCNCGTAPRISRDIRLKSRFLVSKPVLTPMRTSKGMVSAFPLISRAKTGKPMKRPHALASASGKTGNGPLDLLLGKEMQSFTESRWWCIHVYRNLWYQMRSFVVRRRILSLQGLNCPTVQTLLCHPNSNIICYTTSMKNRRMSLVYVFIY